MPRIINISGKRFNKLTVIELSHVKNHRSFYLVKCDCGVIKQMRKDAIVVNESCGCVARKLSKERLKLKPINFRHGHAGTKNKSPTYKTWLAMINRCINPKNNRYSYYGGRGIKVCDRWLESFENFLEDMNERPNINYSIDRIDNNGNYEPKNCRWITKSQNTVLSNINRKSYVS